MEKEFKIKKVIFTERNEFVNRNRRIYDPVELSKALETYKELVSSGKAIGELEQKISYEINIENSVVRVKDINYIMKPGRCEMDIKFNILDTPKGKLLNELIDPVKFSIRPRIVISPKGGIKILAFDLCSETK